MSRHMHTWYNGLPGIHLSISPVVDPHYDIMYLLIVQLAVMVYIARDQPL